MKQHFSIVKTEWLNENLNCEVIVTLDTKEDAEHYFNNVQREFSEYMEKNYTACNYEWKEDFKLYCYCCEGCAELALLVASSDESSKRKIVSVIKHLGEEGTTKTEKYVDIFAKIEYENMTLEQMVYFGDTDTLSAYFLDESNNGYFVDWHDLSEALQNEIANLSIWD